MTTTAPHVKPIRTKLAAAAAACALLTTAALASAGAASASATAGRQSAASLRTALHRDLSRYLTARRTAEHISAVSLRVTFSGSRSPISLAAGTIRYDGGPPVSPRALWQIGSNTKAFTAVILLAARIWRAAGRHTPMSGPTPALAATTSPHTAAAALPTTSGS